VAPHFVVCPDLEASSLLLPWLWVILSLSACPQPTNHLDITAKEVLEEALQHYGGSVVFISHDRYFLSQVANTICAFGAGRVERHDCDYHDYLERHSQAGTRAADEESVQVLDGDVQIEDGSILASEGSKKAKIGAAVAPQVSLKEKVTSRYVAGDRYQITHAKEVLADPTDSGKKDKKKNFGGSGVTCGNPNKGIKNAKRFKHSL
jgi:ABC-type sulfate/molybdate transport systems ATPase subunit